ncbi:MAG: putative DNA (exogenous) processing protein [Osedax symbiont Rs2]|nr:MAG: putative DNA (exogenous) processing protein [Osedax symbiont Rs2]
MLSYQHSYHAGNFADVHKHLTLSLLLESLNKKPKPWSYFETHAGTALYDLSAENATKTGEFKQGVSLLQGKKLPSLFDSYLQVVKQLNTAIDPCVKYPGSPWFASQAARDGDKISLMELHPGEHQQLKALFRRNSAVAVHHRDGYEGVLSLLPPKPNRGLVLIDPSYEVKSEYLQVAKFIEKAYQRWSNGCFAIWYPLLKAGNHHEMLRKIKHSGIRKVLQAEFFVKSATDERMYGSGMLLINPPWHLEQQLQQLSESLYQHLAETSAAPPQIQWLVAE